MKTLFIEASMGVAGDMLMGSLFELIDNKDEFISKINSLKIDGVTVSFERSEKCGINGTHSKVLINNKEEHEHNHDHKHNHEHHNDHDHNHHHHTHDNNHEHHHHHSHTNMQSICHIIEHLDVSNKVKKDITDIYNLIANAESIVHNKSIDMIHFHEVGEKDAIIDIVGCCILMEMINPDIIICSPVHVGKGSIKCAHGILPVPAPATALILNSIPYYSKDIEGELCTPTGAAIIKHFSDEFSDMPLMTVEKIGYGMGTKDFAQANIVRTFLGSDNNNNNNIDESTITELSCNIDDMTGEAMGYAINILLENNALDVFTTPIQMKKNRPAVMLTVLCKLVDADKFAKLMLLHTTSFGIRKKECERYTLERSFENKTTSIGEITIKNGKGYGISKSKPEYESVAKIAKQNNIPLSDVYKIL